MTNNKIQISYLKTSFGELIIGSIDNQLCLCDWRYRKMRNAIDNRIKKYFNADYVEESSEIIEETIFQIKQYFNKERKEFDIPLVFAGTEFQIKVWDALLKIPYGKKDTYLGLSKILENEKAVRAVASANGANAISIIVPCHRIIGSKGELVGYAGGLPTKKKLLQLENAFDNLQLSLF